MRLCSIDHCTRKHDAYGYCKAHGIRWKMHGDARPDIPLKHIAKKGAGSISTGYRVHQQNGKSRSEHRRLMERALCRRLRKNEHVHHKDGNKLNNSLDNLEVLTASEHTRRHKTTGRPACSVDGCTTPRQGRGLCMLHYSRLRDHGNGFQTCIHNGCRANMRAKGYCARHYKRFLNGTLSKYRD